MKFIFGILFILGGAINASSQYQIDWRNAPLNPIPIKYTLNHFKLNGPVKKAIIDDLLGKQILYFNSQGMLDSSVVDDFLGHEKKVFQYDDNGILINLTSQERYCITTNSLISADSNNLPIRYFDHTFKYNQAGLLIYWEFESAIQVYYYNSQNQLSKKENLTKEGQIELTTNYSYTHYKDFIRVVENRVKATDNTDNIWTYEYDTSGHLLSVKNIYDRYKNYLGNDPEKIEAVIEYFEE